jgi:predicted DCC family thiol-disulfide oxidoreductase YuxK
VIYYDGDCGACGAAIRFVRANERANDSSARFRYALYDSDAGRAACAAAGRDPQGEPSLLLEDAAGVHAESEAALRIGRRLRAPWPLLAALAGSIPRPLRDAAYRWVARHRYVLPI